MAKKTQKTATDKRLGTLAPKTKEQKAALITQLTKYPVVETACARAGVGRATYYDWRKRDGNFLKAANEALNSGKWLMNDMAVSTLLRKVQEGNMTATIYWLKNNHPDYSERVHNDFGVEEPEITEQEEHDIGVALYHIGLAGILKLDKKRQERIDATIAEQDRKQDEYRKMAGEHAEDKNNSPEDITSSQEDRPIEVAEPSKKEEHKECPSPPPPPFHKSKKGINLKEFFKAHPELGIQPKSKDEKQ